MPIRLISLSGGPYSRGVVFGRSHGASINAFIRDWLNSLRTAGIGAPETYVTDLLKSTNFLSAIHEYTPEVLEEVQGIAAGTSNHLDLVLACQFMDEEWAFRASRLKDIDPPEKCSTIGIRSAPNESWVAQNMDLGGYTDGHQVALNIAAAPEDLSELVFSVYGMIGLMGVNSSGVGVCVNSLPQLPSVREGLPVAFVIRKLLKARSASEAIHWLKAVPHATGQHYLIADASKIESYEASPGGVLQYRPPVPDRILHTNHPLVVPGTRASDKYESNTAARLKSLVARLANGPVDLATIQLSLSSCDDPNNPVCRIRAKMDPAEQLAAFTTGSMISRLPSDAPVESWLAAGPPSPQDYFKITLPVPRYFAQGS